MLFYFIVNKLKYENLNLWVFWKVVYDIKLKYIVNLFYMKCFRRRYGFLYILRLIEKWLNVEVSIVV